MEVDGELLYTQLVAEFESYRSATMDNTGYVKLTQDGKEISALFMDGLMDSVWMRLPYSEEKTSEQTMDLIKGYVDNSHVWFMVKEYDDGYGGFRLGQSLHEGYEKAMYDVACGTNRMKSSTIEVLSTAAKMVGINDDLSNLNGQFNPWLPESSLETYVEVFDYLTSRDPSLDVFLGMSPRGKFSVSLSNDRLGVTLRPKPCFGLGGDPVDKEDFYRVIDNLTKFGFDFSGDWEKETSRTPL